MTDMYIVGKQLQSVYETSVYLSGYVFALKFDTGAKYTVISVGMFDDTLTEEDLGKIKAYCKKHCNHKERFVSASGHSFWGYLVTAHDAKMGDTKLRDFYYYLVVENQRDIALLGFDFIDNCKGSFEPHSDIILTEFDEDGYGELDGAMESDDVIAFMDSLSGG